MTPDRADPSSPAEDAAGPSTGRQLRLVDLLQERELGLTVAVEGDLERRVLGAHTIEIENPGPWLRPGVLVLTTGLRFTAASSARAQVALVNDLVDHGAAALAFGIGIHLKAPPRPLLEAARKAGLTVLLVPADIPFLLVEDVVGRAMLSSDAYRLQRTLWVQNELLRALGEDRPVAALVATLASLVTGTAVLYEKSGRIVASTGSAPIRLMWSEVRSQGTGRRLFTVGRWHVTARSVAVRGVVHTIALASRREDILVDLGDALLDSTGRLLSAIGGARALGATQARAEADHLLRTLAEGVTPEAAHRIAERLRAFRFVPGGAVHALVAVPLPDPADTAAHLRVDPGSGGGRLLDLHDEAELHGLALLMREEIESVNDLPAGSFMGIVGDGGTLDEWLTALATTHHVGVSESYEPLTQTRARMREARRAVHVGLRRRSLQLSIGRRSSTRAGETGGSIVRFEDVDLATWLISGRNTASMRAKVEQQLEHLLERSDLVEAVVAYLAHHLDVAATASSLFLHPNTVRYRLQRVEDILAAPMSSPAVIANLYLAFHDELDTAGAPLDEPLPVDVVVDPPH